jgi:hypothetical protein
VALGDGRCRRATFIRTRTAESRSRAQKRGRRMGWKTNLMPAQQATTPAGDVHRARHWKEHDFPDCDEAPRPLGFGIRRGQETAQPMKYPGGPAARKCKSNRAPAMFPLHRVHEDFTKPLAHFQE